MKNKFSLSFFGYMISILLFALSLTQIGFCLDDEINCWPGYFIVPFGWLQFLAINEAGPFPSLAWAANPLWLSSIIAGLRKEARLSFYLSLGALMLGTAFFLAKGVAVSEAGGEPSPVTVYGSGLWLWLSCFAVAVAASCSLMRENQK
jgi:hypothetical protein